MHISLTRFAFVFIAVCAGPLFTQQLDKPATAVPRLVRVTGTFHPANGLPIGTTESATLSVYKDEQGGQPLWQETQNVAVDANGQYTAMLGATQRDGVPVDLFSASEPRWLGVQFNRSGEVEQPRVQLVSVPYALRASDAETLGGKPASAYLLDPNGASTGNGSSGPTTSTSSASSNSLKPRQTISGTINYIPYFTDASSDLGNSILYQNGSSYLGIGTTAPSAPLDLEGVIPSAAFIVARYTGSNSQAPTSLPMAVRTARGTHSSPSAVQQSDILGPYTAQAFDGTGFGSAGQIIYWADQNWTSSQHGSYLTLTTVADGTTSAVERLRITNAGNVGIGTTTPGSALDVAGSINFSGVLSNQGTPVLQFVSNGNMAVGAGALASNPTGGTNTAIGGNALSLNTSGFTNTAIGTGALQKNTTGNNNNAVGAALLSNSGGSFNAAMGDFALQENTTGSYNIAIGSSALEMASGTVDSNIAIGYSAASNLSGGSNNIAIGSNAASFVFGSPSNNIHIGTLGGFADNGTIRIGGNPNLGDSAAQTQFFVSGVRGITTGNNDAIPVLIDSAGQLGTVSSSRRYKEDIQDMGDASSGLMRLRPVTFRYKKPFDNGSKPIQYGLIAEEVAEVYPDLVAHSADGQIETVKYQVLDSMLLNEVQKQQKEITTLKDQNQALQDRLIRLEEAMAKMAIGAGSQ